MNSPLILLFLTLLSFGLSCNKDKDTILSPVSVPGDETSAQFELPKNINVLWTKNCPKQIHSLQSLVLDNKVIFVVSDENIATFNYYLLALDKTSGDTLWRWNDGMHLMKEVLCFDNKLYFYGSAVGKLTCVDANTGLTLWQWDDNTYRVINGLTAAHGRIYTSAGYGHSGIRGMAETRILSFDPFQSAPFVEYVFETEKRGGSSLSLYDPLPWTHPNGDLIMFYNPSATDGNGLTSHAEFLAVNLSADSIYLDLKNHFSASAKGRSTLINNQVYFGAAPDATPSWKTGCLNLVTMEILWVNTLTHTYPSSVQYKTSNGILLMNSGNTNYVNAIAANSGKLLWTNTSCGTQTSPFQMYDGLAWLKSGEGILGLSPHTGDITKKVRHYQLHQSLWEQKMEGWSVGEFSTFTIDHQTGYFYALGDQGIITCFSFTP